MQREQTDKASANKIIWILNCVFCHGDASNAVVVK